MAANLLKKLKQIENLNIEDFAKAMEYNGFPECVQPILKNSIDGYLFLTLGEFQLMLWRLSSVQTKRILKFLEKVKENPNNFRLMSDISQKNEIGKFNMSSDSTYGNTICLTRDKNDIDGELLKRAIKKGEIKDKLEQIHRSGAAQIPHQKAPLIPPLPYRQKPSTNVKKVEHVSDDSDDNEGYLPPVKKEIAQSKKAPRELNRNSSFLWAESYENDKPNATTLPSAFKNKDRPLPPIPSRILKPADVPKKTFGPIVLEDENIYMPVEEDDTQLPNKKPIPEYITVLADESERTLPFRSLPPRPPNFDQFKRFEGVEDDEHLAEYGSIESDHEDLPTYEPIIEDPPTVSKFPTSNKLLPPLLPKIPIKRIVTPPKTLLVTTSDSEDEQNTEVIRKMMVKSLDTKSPQNTLPKPPVPMFPKPHDGSNKDIFKDIQTSHSPTEEIYNVENDPFYRKTDRTGARLLLRDFEEGAFLVRPSRNSNYVCTISIMHSSKMYNVGIKKNFKGALVLDGQIKMNEQEFRTVKELIDYYTVDPIYLSGYSITLKKVLPKTKF